jgi:hypothetical protein
MYTALELEEYAEEARKQVCTHCVERAPFGPPCAPLGKVCGIERHLPQFLDAIHEVDSNLIEPYLDNIHRRVCSTCPRLGQDDCPCPLDYLLVLLVQAVETVDQRNSSRKRDRSLTGPYGHDDKCAKAACGCAEIARSGVCSRN